MVRRPLPDCLVAALADEAVDQGDLVRHPGVTVNRPVEASRSFAPRKAIKTNAHGRMDDTIASLLKRGHISGRAGVENLTDRQCQVKPFRWQAGAISRDAPSASRNAQGEEKVMAWPGRLMKHMFMICSNSFEAKPVEEGALRLIMRSCPISIGESS